MTRPPRKPSLPMDTDYCTRTFLCQVTIHKCQTQELNVDRQSQRRRHIMAAGMVTHLVAHFWSLINWHKRLGSSNTQVASLSQRLGVVCELTMTMASQVTVKGFLTIEALLPQVKVEGFIMAAAGSLALTVSLCRSSSLCDSWQSQRCRRSRWTAS